LKKKIFFFHKSLDIGGVERQLVYLIKGLNENKYELYLILCEKKGELLQEIPSHVKLINLGISFSIKNKIPLAIKLCHKLIRKRPDIFISFHIHLNTLSILIGLLLKIRVFLCSPGFFYKGRINFLRNILWNYANKIIAVSNGVKRSLENALTRIEKKKLIVIKNAVDYEEVIKLSEEEFSYDSIPMDKPIVASVGRLVKDKGFDVLLNAVPLVESKCRIVLIGDGPERKRLERLCKELKITKNVVFLGSQSNPYKYLKKSSIFVLASLSEGLPTAVLEAMALKVPCVCADYLGGVNDIIIHEKNGYIVKKGDSINLARAIDILLNDEERRKKYQNVSFKKIKNEFSIQNYMKEYEKLFDEKIN